MSKIKSTAYDEMLYINICRTVGGILKNDAVNELSLADMADIFGCYYNAFAGKELPLRWRCYEEVYQCGDLRAFFSHNIPEGSYDKGSVLLFSHNFSRTGAPMILLDAAKAFMESGYCVTVVSGEIGGLLPVYLDNGVSCIIIPEVADGKAWPKDIVMQLADGYDIIFVNTGVMGHVVDAFNFGNKKVFWWFHERKNEIEALGGLEYLPECLGDNITAAVVAEGLKAELVNSGIRYDFREFEGYVPDLIKEDIIKEKGVSFVICGVICERKGYDVLLDALDKLGADALKNVSFWIVGQPDDRSMTERIKQLSETYDIHYCTSLSRTEMYMLYEKCDCCIVPSRFEPLPLVALESMSCEAFVICNDCVGVSKYFSDELRELVYHDSGSAKQLADRIKYVIDNPDKYREWGKESRRIYEKTFTWERFKGRIAGIPDRKPELKKNSKASFILNDFEKAGINQDMLSDYINRCFDDFFMKNCLMDSRIGISEMKYMRRIDERYISWANETIQKKDEVIGWKDDTIAGQRDVILQKDMVISQQKEKIGQTKDYCGLLEKDIRDREEKIRQTEDYCGLLEKDIRDKEEKIRQTEEWAEMQRQEREKLEAEVARLNEELKSSIYLRIKRKVNNIRSRKED